MFSSVRGFLTRSPQKDCQITNMNDPNFTMRSETAGFGYECLDKVSEEDDSDMSSWKVVKQKTPQILMDPIHVRKAPVLQDKVECQNFPTGPKSKMTQSMVGMSGSLTL